MEPFQSPSELEDYRRSLGLAHARVNSSTKIWIFRDGEWEKFNSTNSLQQLTMEYKMRERNDNFKITVLYTRCSSLDRLKL